MGRSNTRSHSSRSKSRSPSSSRSRSHSRKKRYSSRSRSRTYSRSRSRERIYNRDFRRDYRNNRGMRRPYGFRGRARGYYQGGGGRYHRGGYRPMWNRRYSRSPRRGRSRSRSPKRRSVSSQRSRSRSHKSYKSSQSPRSSSSRSSSRYSRSPVTKTRSSQEKKSQRVEADKSESPLNTKSRDDQKDAFDPSEPLDELGKELDLHGESWAGLSAYDNSPRSPCSPSPVASPPSQSSSHSDGPIMSVVHSAKDTLSQNSHSIAHTPERSRSGSGGNGSTRYSPSQNSPLHLPSHKSPTKPVLTQNPTREESRSRYSLYTNPAEQEVTKSTKFLKRYTDEEHRLFPIEKISTREKESQKERGSDKLKKEVGRVWDDHEASGYFGEKNTVKPQFLTISESEDLEEAEDYRQFRKSVLADQGKSLFSTSHWNSDDEGTKYKNKVSMKGTKEGEKNKEGKGHKGASKDLHKDDEKSTEKSVGKKDIQLMDKVKLEKMKDIFSYSLSLSQSIDVREKTVFREESPLRLKMVATESHHPEVKLRKIAVPLDDNRPSSLTNDRLLASTLVHSFKKVQDFRSIFDHMKVSFASKTSPESFTYHVVSLVQYVKEHYFKGDGKTLSERFAGYQKVTELHARPPKSPEIHRRIDISPNIPRKHTRVQGEEKAVKEEPQKVEKVRRSGSTDMRSNVTRPRKEHSKERGDSKCSRESSGSRKKEKTQKELKDFKIFKDDNKHRKEHEPPSSPSSTCSHEERENKKEREEEFKGPLEPKEFSGFAGVSRPRGTFFRIRGRGRARGVFAGTSTGPVNTATTFQKRPKEEEWDPEYTPKSKKYFLHDDRDDGVDYWAKRARGRGNFQRGRGRFTFKKSGSSPKWTHDKYQGDGILEDEDEGLEDRRKDE
ncbi:bcl-2-associated transcription factor 1 isoform 2-T2 [Pelodytes ibericus]